jgi:anti-anti-sigma regulatory factor
MDGQQIGDLKEPGDTSEVTVAVSGALTIERSGEFRQILTNALAGAQRVVLDVGQLHDIDLTALQLICAACKTAAAADKTFIFAGPLPDCLMALKDGIGVCQNSPCSQNGNAPCIWFGGTK